MMETFGGLTAVASVDFAMLYDYNYECGFLSSIILQTFCLFTIVIGPNPEELEYFSVSTGVNVETMPCITNAELEESYLIYIDI